MIGFPVKQLKCYIKKIIKSRKVFFGIIISLLFDHRPTSLSNKITVFEIYKVRAILFADKSSAKENCPNQSMAFIKSIFWRSLECSEFSFFFTNFDEKLSVGSVYSASLKS